MRITTVAAFAILCVFIAPLRQAHADCADDINKALDQARALPASSGKPMVLEEIERARTDRHENDELGCEEKIKDVLDMLKQNRAAQGPAAPSKD